MSFKFKSISIFFLALLLCDLGYAETAVKAEDPLGLETSPSEPLPESKKVRRVRRVRKKKKNESEEVDLSAMDKPTKPETSSGASENPHGHGSFHSGGTNAPSFKTYFDFLLTNRPGQSPLSFDSFHSIILLDYIPSPGVMFTTEIPFGTVRPTPRFFELDVDLGESFQIRLGKIWIPFDEADPHFSFGGLMNTFEFNAGSQTNFLPDLWADLGLGFKYKIVNSRFMKLETHLFVVNGFPDGGTDPGSNTGNTVYPNFGIPAKVNDNNTDKAFGGRISSLISNMFGVGFSAYTGRYTDDGLPSGRVTVFGIDGKLRLPTNTQFRAGYAFMSVNIPPGLSVPSVGAASRDTLQRGGAYFELSQRFGKFRGLIRGGILNGDSRVEDANDREIFALRVEYNINPMFQLSIEHRKDIKTKNSKGDDLVKPNKEYSALRFVIKM